MNDERRGVTVITEQMYKNLMEMLYEHRQYIVLREFLDNPKRIDPALAFAFYNHLPAILNSTWNDMKDPTCFDDLLEVSTPQMQTIYDELVRMAESEEIEPYSVLLKKLQTKTGLFNTEVESCLEYFKIKGYPLLPCMWEEIERDFVSVDWGKDTLQSTFRPRDIELTTLF